MKLIWGGIILAGLVAVLSVAAIHAASGPVTLEEKDRGSAVTLQVGQGLILNLRNPASGGYTTQPPVFDARILQLKSQAKLPPAPRQPPLMGDFGQLHYEWQAVAKGQTEIVINIFRSWEKKAPQEFWRVQVTVK